MSGKFVSIAVKGGLWTTTYDYKPGTWVAISNTTFKLPTDKENTYVCIFGPKQETKRLEFEKQKGLNILFKSKKAVNGNYRGDAPRNTLYVFEVK